MADRPSTTAAAAQGASPLARLLLLPDLSATGSAALSWRSFDAGGAPRAGPFGEARRLNPVFEEVELGIQAAVDPYARADVFLAFSEEGAEVEEAYVTALALPAGLLARAGKLFTPFGRLNQQHPHAQDFVDRPLPLVRLLAPENLGGAGVNVAWLAPLPWYAELHLTYQAVNLGLDEESPARRAGSARVVQYFDVTGRASLGVGVSGALAEEPEDGWRDLAGTDVHLRLRTGSGARPSHVTLTAEALWSRLRGVPGVAEEDAWGAYAQAVHRPARRLAYGVRWERAPGVLEGALAGAEHRVSALAAFLPSEFQRIRLQGGWTRFPGGRDGLEAILGLEFSMGAHGAHPF
jgi:hypothetical protein